MSVACSPPEPALDAGFYRDNVSQLPRNARGVMFLPPSTKPKASDFKLTSPDDKRPLALRLHSLGKSGQIRLEPVGGFAPKARYTFQYLPAHERWRYPDRMSVTIDDKVVDTAGAYAIELAPQPEIRMIVVPGSPACIEPAVALAQPFSYRIPAALLPYRAALKYGTDVAPERSPNSNKAMPGLAGWPFQPTSYYSTIFLPHREIIDDYYSGADDVIVAACDQPRLRGKLTGSVAFPELDDKAYRAAPVTIDLSKKVVGKCRPLDALTRTMQVYGAEKALGAVCDRTYGFDPNPSNSAASTDRWERALEMLYDLSPTCTLVSLEHAISRRQYAPDRNAMGRMGAALAEGLRVARVSWLAEHKPAESEPVFLQTVDGLDYLMRGLPAPLRPNTSAMLSPLLPELTVRLAEQKPYRPDAVAALIVRAGSLPTDVRARIMSIAQGRTIGAPHARAILIAIPGQPHKGLGPRQGGR